MSLFLVFEPESFSSRYDTSMSLRYRELDLLRTLAIVMMVIYHVAYDLQQFYGFRLGLFESNVWYLLRQSTATLFLLLVGISFAIRGIVMA